MTGQKEKQPDRPELLNAKNSFNSPRNVNHPPNLLAYLTFHQVISNVNTPTKNNPLQENFNLLDKRALRLQLICRVASHKFTYLPPTLSKRSVHREIFLRNCTSLFYSLRTISALFHSCFFSSYLH
ncbi:BA75_01705T0 [Komagataella pastoris]|uniref:BA75_01705T0 n=1 Tax=Komagataella pastoris TaxID=4922 RepID=A0A1B2J938_PICPA|nr:BA75_01705T0 [Komagataella pastoris]